MIIYKIVNKLNGKMYIGQTSKSLELRFKQHCQLKRKRSCRLLQNAIKKYGKENFSIEVLEACETRNAANIREIYWIKHFDTFHCGYNLTTGGDSYELSPISKEKIRRALLGKPSPLKGIPSGRTAWNKGKPWSIETRKKMSASHSGVHYKKPSGWKLSEESRRKMSLARKGKINFQKSIICIETNKIYKSGKDAAKDLKLQPAHISDVLKGRRRHTGGYTFKYV